MSFFETNNNLHRSIILAGGGVRLAYHAGVLMALEEERLSFNHIDGTSGGIFGTAMMASGITPAEAAERWRKLKLSGFMSAFSAMHLNIHSSAGFIRRIRTGYRILNYLFNQN